MTLNSSGPISLAGTITGQSIEIENGGNGTTTISLNDAAVRSLAGVPSGAIIMPTNFWGKSNGPPPYNQVIFAFGGVTPQYSITNLVSFTGVVGSDVSNAVPAKNEISGARYGGDKAIVGYGNRGTGSSINGYNLITNTGALGSEQTGSGQSRSSAVATPFGNNQAIFYGGVINNDNNACSLSTQVSNTGVFASDTSTADTGTYNGVAVSINKIQGFLAWGLTGGSFVRRDAYSIISNTGVIGSFQSISGATSRIAAAATPYGGDKACMAYGGLDGNGYPPINTSNLISNTGLISADISGVGTARERMGAGGYGADKGIFGYGGQGINITQYNVTNLVSNTGAVASDTAGVGTPRQNLASPSYG